MKLTRVNVFGIMGVLLVFIVLICVVVYKRVSKPATMTATSTTATSTTATSTPAVYTPATFTPATSIPATSIPATSTPATFTPATSTPAVFTSSVETPIYVPFNVGAQVGTGANYWGGGNSIFLDRHNIDCGNKPLNQLNLIRPAEDQIEWKYKCADGGRLGTPTAKTTPANDWGGGNTIFLDRHDADCGPGNVMTQLRLNRPSDFEIQWEYKCAPSTQSKPLTCRQVTTDPNDDGGGNSIFLDRHDIKCNADEAISKIHLVRPSENQIQWKYTCCR